MNPWQQDVLDFHRALDIPTGCGCGQPMMPNADRRALRAELIREEAAETIAAIEAGKLVDTIDGLCDLIVVALGCAIEMGVDLEDFWNEVHGSNMAKQGGATREDGKKLKPEGWLPPNLRGLLMKDGQGQYVTRTQGRHA